MNCEDVISNKKEYNVIGKKFLESFLVGSSKFRSSVDPFVMSL
jgi:hypothetical protein